MGTRLLVAITCGLVCSLTCWASTVYAFVVVFFQLICSYIFWIIPFVMGVDAKDCLTVAELIGTKLVINEFVAYEKLGDFIDNRESCIAPYISVSAVFLYSPAGAC